MELIEKIELFSETRTSKHDPNVKGMRPIQFMQWWGDFRPGDRVDVMFGEDYIGLAGTNAEGHFSGVKKEMDIDDPDEMMAFRNMEGRIWNFV